MKDKKITSKNGDSLSPTQEKELMKRIERASKTADRNSILVSGEETESGWQTVAKKRMLIPAIIQTSEFQVYIMPQPLFY